MIYHLPGRADGAAGDKPREAKMMVIPTGNDRDSLSVTRGIPKKAKV